MLVGSELAIDRAQMERAHNRKNAIMAKGGLQGYKFIRLVLKNIRKRRISGIDVLMATEFTNDQLGGMPDYQLDLRGGDIEFEYRPEFGQFVYDMVDTERNRNFLATHSEYDFWDIQDPMIVYDVKNRLEKIKQDIVAPKKKTKTPAELFWEEANRAEQQAVRVHRGEVMPEEVEPKIQNVAPVANTPEAPGYIAPPPKTGTQPRLIKPKVGWRPGTPRGPRDPEVIAKAVKGSRDTREAKKLKLEDNAAPEDVASEFIGDNSEE